MKHTKPGRPVGTGKNDWHYLKQVADLVAGKKLKKTPACSKVAIKYFGHTYAETNRRRLLRKYNENEETLLTAARERLSQQRQDRIRSARKPFGIFTELENLISDTGVAACAAVINLPQYDRLLKPHQSPLLQMGKVKNLLSAISAVESISRADLAQYNKFLSATESYHLKMTCMQK